jgi:hypothetical protein
MVIAGEVAAIDDPGLRGGQRVRRDLDGQGALGARLGDQLGDLGIVQQDPSGLEGDHLPLGAELLQKFGHLLLVIGRLGDHQERPDAFDAAAAAGFLPTVGRDDAADEFLEDGGRQGRGHAGLVADGGFLAGKEARPAASHLSGQPHIVARYRRRRHDERPIRIVLALEKVLDVVHADGQRLDLLGFADLDGLFQRAFLFRPPLLRVGGLAGLLERAFVCARCAGGKRSHECNSENPSGQAGLHGESPSLGWQGRDPMLAAAPMIPALRQCQHL